jgi:uncharacterized membrane protein YdbT with pleckstrin-like domain
VAAMNDERDVWQGGPSQWQNLGWFVSCILLLPIPFALWKWLETRSHRYVLTDQRLQLSRGILNRVTEDLELYRVRDTRLEQPFWQRMLGLGEVVLFTTDASTPEIHLPWMADAAQLRETLRRLVEARREAKHVRTFETGIE